METGETGTEVIDEGAKRDRHGRMRWPKARRLELLAAYERSGLSQAEFAREAGVCYPTFAHWVQVRRREQAFGSDGAATTPATRGAQFVELRLPPGAVAPTRAAGATGAELSVSLPDGVVVRGTDAAAIAALVAELRTARR